MHGRSLDESVADVTVFGYYLSIHEDFTTLWDVGALVDGRYRYNMFPHVP